MNQPPSERLAYTLPQFLEAVGVSRPKFYSLPEGERPPTFTIGRRRYVSEEDARAWVRRRAQQG